MSFTDAGPQTPPAFALLVTGEEELNGVGEVTTFIPRPCQRGPLGLSGSPGSAGPTVPTREAWLVGQEALAWPARVQRLLSPCPEGALSLRVGFRSTPGDQLLVGSVYFLDTKS